MLRKTHSQPQPAKTSTLPQPKSSTSDKKSSQKQDAKHSRAKSVPSPVHTADAKKAHDSGKEPASPTGKDPSDKKAGSSSGGSPKPKRNFLEGFKNTLRPKKSLGSGDSNSKSAKDKGDSNSSGTSPASEQYANQPVSDATRDADTKASSSGGTSSAVNNTQIVSWFTKGPYTRDHRLLTINE